MDFIDKYTGWIATGMVPWLILLLLAHLFEGAWQTAFCAYTAVYAVPIVVWYYHLFKQD